MNYSEKSDHQLLQLALNGREEAFVALYRRWQTAIYRFALRTSNSASIAEDITQEVFLSVMAGGSNYDPLRGTFASYLFGIARHRLFTRIKRENTFTSIPEEAEGEENDPSETWRILFDPLLSLTRQESIEALYRVIGSLPLRYREVVVLCELQELGYAEAAQVVGCPEGTIRSRLHRARSMLLEKLRPRKEQEICQSNMQTVRCVS